MTLTLGHLKITKFSNSQGNTRTSWGSDGPSSADEKESLKHPLATHLLFTAPTGLPIWHNQPYLIYFKLLLYYPGSEGDWGGGCNNPI